MGHDGDTVKNDQFADLMSHVGRGAGASTVYGEPTIVGDRAVIPVAEVKWGGGGGWGGGSTEASDDELAEAPSGSGEGLGMGFGVSAKPKGALEVTADGVHWSPVFDWGKLVQIWSLITGFVVVVAAVKWLFSND